jgi:four helix bundle protein
MSRDHRKLDAFLLADQLVVRVYEVTLHVPASERQGLGGQLRRTAVSVAANIVEGCARSSERDVLRFLDIAFGSSRELNYLLSVATRLDWMSPTAGTELEALGSRVAAALAALRKFFRHAIAEPKASVDRIPSSENP